MLAGDQGKRQIGAQREKGGTLHVYAMLSGPLEWFGGIDFADPADPADPAAAAARITQACDGWAPELTALFTDSDIAPVTR